MPTMQRSTSKRRQVSESPGTASRVNEVRIGGSEPGVRHSHWHAVSSHETPTKPSPAFVCPGVTKQSAPNQHEALANPAPPSGSR